MILLTELKEIVSEVKESMALCITWEVMHILNREPEEFFDGRGDGELTKEELSVFFGRMIEEQAAFSQDEEGNGNYRKRI